jgi:hypothetical protein
MCNLFIIGNGFDLDHGLPTAYSNFRKYLESTYEIKHDSLEQPSITMTEDHHGYDYSDSDVASFLFNLVETTSLRNDGGWSDFEDALGEFCAVFEDHHLTDLEYIDNEGDVDFIKTERNKADMCADLYPVTRMGKYFTEWISTCATRTERKLKFANLLDPEKDFFLNFNYTETLETVYNAKTICHVHGEVKTGIIVGHGAGKRTVVRDEETGYAGEAEEALDKIHEELRKDTAQALRRHKRFFDSLAGIKNVYSYGFNYSNVDMVYIAEICKKLSKDSVWHFDDYDPAAHPGYQNKILRCGFKGKFSVFTRK